MDKAEFLFNKISQQVDISAAQKMVDSSTKEMSSKSVKAPGNVPLKTSKQSMPSPKVPPFTQQKTDLANTTVSNTAMNTGNVNMSQIKYAGFPLVKVVKKLLYRGGDGLFKVKKISAPIKKH